MTRLSFVSCIEAENGCTGTVYIPDTLGPAVYPVFCDNELEPHTFCVEITSAPGGKKEYDRPPRSFKCDPVTKKEGR